MVKENKFFKVPGKLSGALILGQGKLTIWKKKKILYLLAWEMVFFIGEGQTKFLPIARIACLPKTYRFLSLFFLEGTEGHMLEYFFSFFKIILKPKLR